MSINVFEGARRIAKLVALIWVVGCVTVIISDITINMQAASEVPYKPTRAEFRAMMQAEQRQPQQEQREIEPQTQSNEEQIDSRWWSKRSEQIGWLFGGVAFIWALTWAVGWIVRGFLGISSGQDFKS